MSLMIINEKFSSYLQNMLKNAAYLTNESNIYEEILTRDSLIEYNDDDNILFDILVEIDDTKKLFTNSQSIEIVKNKIFYNDFTNINSILLLLNVLCYTKVYYDLINDDTYNTLFNDVFNSNLQKALNLFTKYENEIYDIVSTYFAIHNQDYTFLYQLEKKIVNLSETPLYSVVHCFFVSVMSIIDKYNNYFENLWSFYQECKLNNLKIIIEIKNIIFTTEKNLPLYILHFKSVSEFHKYKPFLLQNLILCALITFDNLEKINNFDYITLKKELIGLIDFKSGVVSTNLQMFLVENYLYYINNTSEINFNLNNLSVKKYINKKVFHPVLFTNIK